MGLELLGDTEGDRYQLRCGQVLDIITDRRQTTYFLVVSVSGSEHGAPQQGQSS